MKKQIGNIAVDAGLVWVGDPCYCVTPDCDEHPAQTWSEFCDMLNVKDKYYNLAFKNGIEGLGVCVNTLHGDGFYPVYADVDDEGRIKSITVSFDRGEGE